MSKPLYDSPDVPLIDYTNTGGYGGGPRGYKIDDRTLAKKTVRDNDARRMLDNLRGVVREGDVMAMTAAAGDVSETLKYLSENIPSANMYMSGMGEEATDEEKISAIIKGLEARAEAIDEYNNRVPAEAPFLGNEVEEARSKQEGPNISQRYKSQYDVIPGVRQKESRGAVKSYKVQRNPKTKLTRIKFL
jgi:hypothetical protein